jgi:hypothetical protein
LAWQPYDDRRPRDVTGRSVAPVLVGEPGAPIGVRSAATIGVVIETDGHGGRHHQASSIGREAEARGDGSLG